MNSKEEFTKRLQELVSHFSNGNRSHFANLLGVNESTIRNYFNGTLPKIDFLIKLIEVLSINGHWLLTGDGGMLAQSSVENAVNTSLLTKGDEKRDEKEDNRLNEKHLSNDPSLMMQLVEKIEAQANTIGRLESELRQLHSQVGAQRVNREDAGVAGCADVG